MTKRGCSELAPTEHAQAAETRLKAEAAAWHAPTDAESILWATDAEIPVLDLGPYFATDTVRDLENAATTLNRAKDSTGFHYIVNHGVQRELIDRALAMCERFHLLPDDVKGALAMDSEPSGAHEVRAGCGYLGHVNSKLPARPTPNYNAAFIVKREIGPRNVTLDRMPWPDEELAPSICGFRQTVEAYCDAMEQLAKRMLPIYAVALGLQPSYFDPAFETPLYRMRLSQYLLTPPGKFGINPHVDTSFFTILRPSGPGLVVHSRRADRWVRAPYRAADDAFVVNFGELLAQISNDTWPATRHYALHAEPAIKPHEVAPSTSERPAASAPRYSLPFFFNASPAYRVPVAPTCCGDDRPARYPPLSYLEGQGVAQGE